MPTIHLLLHLPDRGKRLTSSPATIEEHRSLAEERGYVWLCKPGPPLDQSLCQELESALQRAEEVCVFLFVRLSLDEPRLALYRGRLLDVQGPGPNPDPEHILTGLRGRSCGTWLKVADLQALPADHIDRLCSAETGEPVPIWTDLRTDWYTVVEGEPQAAQSQEPGYSYWLLCLGNPRAKAEFDQSWRFRPIVTYQPGSTEFVTEHERATTPQRVLVYDRVFGSPTYLTVLGIYEVAELIPQGTTAGALLYAAKLREVLRFSNPPRLDPHHANGLWGKLDMAHRQTDWHALVSGERVLLTLSDEDYERILAQAGHEVTSQALDHPPLAPTGDARQNQSTSAAGGPEIPDITASRSALETITAKPAHAVTEVECYHLLRSLERALREFIDRELSRVSRDWWAEGRLPLDSRTRAEERKQKREHPFPWLSQQDLPAKEYLDFSDYTEIITLERNWKDVFQLIFISPEVIRGKLIELNILRNDIAHMRELQPLDKETFIAVTRQLLLTIRIQCGTDA